LSKAPVLSWGDAPRFDIAGLQPVGEAKSLKGSNTKDGGIASICR